MYLLTIHTSHIEEGCQSRPPGTEWDSAGLLQQQWQIAGLNIHIAYQKTVPVKKLCPSQDKDNFTLQIGTQVADSTGIPTGPWVKVEIKPNSGQLTITRDPVGFMAAFVAKVTDGYLISDSVPLLLQNYQVSREIDLSAFNEYWFLDYCIAPKTIWCAIRAVPNGFKAVFALNGENEPSYKQYYIPGEDQGEARLSKKDAPAVLRQIILEVTQQNLTALKGGHYINLLSGGVDSSVVFAACNLLGYKPDYAITFKGDGGADESGLAELTAKRFGVNIKVISSDSTDFIADAYEISRTWGQPYAHSSVTAMQAMLAQVTDGAAVFTGDGGGEAFKGGSIKLNLPRRIVGVPLSGLLGALPDSAQCAAYQGIATRSHFGRGLFWWLEFAASQNEAQMSVNSQPITLLESKVCFKDGYRYEISKSAIESELARVAALNTFKSTSSSARALLFSYAPEGVYAKTWRILDRAGLTGFAPLTAPSFFEAVKRIPSVERGLDKIALREAFSDVLPASVLNAPKRGLTPINRRLLRDAAKKGMPWLASKTGTAWDQIFKGDVLASMWQAHADGKVFRTNLLYKSIVFRCWAEQWEPVLPPI